MARLAKTATPDRQAELRARPAPGGRERPCPKAKTSRRLAGLVETALYLTLALVAFFSVRHVFSPYPAIETAIVSKTASLEQEWAREVGSAALHPFQPLAAASSGPGVAARPQETALNLKLYGTWRGKNGPLAVIAVGDGAQALFAAGEEVADGVRLQEVHDEHIVISHYGARETATIVNRVPSSLSGAAMDDARFSHEARAVLQTPPLRESAGPRANSSAAPSGSEAAPSDGDAERRREPVVVPLSVSEPNASD